MKAAEEFMEAEASSVFELDPDKGDISVRLARGDKGVLMRSKRLQPGEGIAGRIIQSGQGMIVEDVKTDPRFSDRFDTETGFATRSLICVPLTIRGRIIGALQVLNKRNGNSFSERDCRNAECPSSGNGHTGPTFVTSKTIGAGLGLTMVYQIVTNHEGEIDIKSSGGNGTTVSLELPIGLEPEMEE